MDGDQLITVLVQEDGPYHSVGIRCLSNTGGPFFFYYSKEEVIKILCFMSGKLLFFNYSLYVPSSVLEHFETVIKK